MYCNVFKKNRLVPKIILTIFSLCHLSDCLAIEVPVDHFSIASYTQNVNDYLNANNEDSRKNLLSIDYQHQQLSQLYNHYYSTDSWGLSPWSEQMVKAVLPLMKKVEPEVLAEFNNQDKSEERKHFGENFKEHDIVWWNKIKDNMDLGALNSSTFHPENRAITVANTFARALPEIAPDFFNVSLAGQGFPFDNLQESAVWAGTPLYVLSTSKDKAWSLVLTPDGYFAWLKSNDIAYVSASFINQWQQAAKKNLIAVIKTEAPITNAQQQFQFTGYIGAVFPMVQRNGQETSIYIPVKYDNQQARIKVGIINTTHSAIMPMPASKKNMSKILSQLQNRPYGWGGAFFYNDCSQEMKSIFTPFGIWLPRNSGQQSMLSSTIDLSANPVNERLNMLKENGHPLTTLVYIGGHVMLYVGNQEMANHETEAITYQNVWGMSPVTNDKRYVIGQSLFFPLLKNYPNNPDVMSMAEKATFKLIYLDQLNTERESPQEYAEKFMGGYNPS